MQNAAIHRDLVIARHQRSVGGGFGVLVIVPGQSLADFGASGGKRRHDGFGNALNVKASVHMGALDLIAQLADVHGQFGPVHGAQLHLVVEQAGPFDGTPFAVSRAGHVGDDRMGVQVRVLIAVDLVTEKPGDHFKVALLELGFCRAVPDAGFKDLFLDVIERRLDRLVMGFDQAHVACDQSRDGDAFGCGEGQIDPGAVFPLAVHGASKPPPIRRVAVKYALKVFRFDMAGVSGACRPFAVPLAGKLRLFVSLSVIAVGIIIGGHALRG